MCCATRPRDGLGVGDAEATLTSGPGASVGLPGAPHCSAAGPALRNQRAPRKLAAWTMTQSPHPRA
jgi:hypothetical protein